MENSPKSGFPWNFTTVVTAQGYCYVKAYKMKWDPVLKKSKRHLQRHVRILICVNGVLKHVNTPDSYLRERCANIGDSVRSLA